MTPTASTTRTISSAALPPLVQGLPLLGSTLDLFRNPVALFVKAYQELGPVFRVRVPGREYTVLAGPEATLFLAQGGEAYVSSRKVFSKVMRELRTENSSPPWKGRLIAISAKFSNLAFHARPSTATFLACCRRLRAWHVVGNRISV